MDPTSDKNKPDDAEATIRRLDAELMAQRLARQQAGNPYSGWRTASIIFVLVIVMAAAAAFYYVFFLGGLEEARARNAPRPTPAANANDSP